MIHHHKTKLLQFKIRKFKLEMRKSNFKKDFFLFHFVFCFSFLTNITKREIRKTFYSSFISNKKTTFRVHCCRIHRISEQYRKICQQEAEKQRQQEREQILPFVEGVKLMLQI
jgi:hypothetical protein